MIPSTDDDQHLREMRTEKKKKKKNAWQGRKPALHLFVYLRNQPARGSLFRGRHLRHAEADSRHLASTKGGTQKHLPHISKVPRPEKYKKIQRTT